MKTRIFIMVLCLCSCLPALAQKGTLDRDASNITNRVEALLDAYANADDLMDETLLQKRAELEAMGDKTFPALCSFLKTKESPVYQARIIEVFLRVDGDSKLPLKAVRELLQEKSNTKKASPAHHAALRYLAEKGTAEDVVLLSDYTSSSNLVTRTLAKDAKTKVQYRKKKEASTSGQ